MEAQSYTTLERTLDPRCGVAFLHNDRIKTWLPFLTLVRKESPFPIGAHSYTMTYSAIAGREAPSDAKPHD